MLTVIKAAYPNIPVVIASFLQTNGSHLKAQIFPKLSQGPYSQTALLFFHTIWL